jgi:hypothetical protein
MRRVTPSVWTPKKGVLSGVLRLRGIGGSSSDFFGTGIAVATIRASLVPFTGMLTVLPAQTFE